MEECVPLTEENPRKKANLLSKLGFAWMIKICYKGNTKDLEMKDLYKCQEKDESAVLTDRLQKMWDKELERGKLKKQEPSLLRALIKTFLPEYIQQALQMLFVVVVLRSLQPTMLASLLRCFADSSRDLKDIAIYAGALSLVTLMAVLFVHHTNVSTNLIGMRIRVAVSSLVYRKILRLSQLSLSNTAAGKVVNLLSNDVARFDVVLLTLNYMWVAPIQLVTVTCLMWMQMGPSCLVGIFAILILTLPLQMFMGKVTSKYRMAVAKKTDHRVRVMSELLAGIQVIKMYTWEKPFEYVVKEVRKAEVGSLTKTSYARALMISFKMFVDRASLAITIIFYVLMGHEIRADLVFSLAMFFNSLQLTFATMLPNAISFVAETKVSIKRLRSFLLLEEKEVSKLKQSEDQSIRLQNVSACWVPESPTLNNVQIVIQPGTLCGIIGPVGSGKSSLLKVLIGELGVSSGAVELSGNISYASQEPWVFSSSVRNNILFGKEYDRKRYKNIVRVCALEKDFEQFSGGDQMMVSDRGVSLSGGQRARINLARAVYQESDIYLLDDPLSAVDTKVGKHLFDKCIIGYLTGKTRILVTHQLQYLKKADIIIILNKGGVEAIGTFEELSRINLESTKMLIAADESTEAHQSRKISRQTSVTSITTISSCEDQPEEKKEKKNKEEVVNFKGSAFWSYFKHWKSLPLNIIVFFLIFLCQVILSGVDYWIALWTDQEDLRQTNKTSNSHSSNLRTSSKNTTRLFNIIDDFNDEFTDLVYVNGEAHHLFKEFVLRDVYIFLVAAGVIFIIIRSMLFFYSCMRSSKNLHNNMFHCLLESPMRFFDVNPPGRVLNRFSKDMGSIDELLPRSLLDVMQLLLNMTGIIIMVLIPNPSMSVAVIILGFVFLKLRGWFSKVAKAVKHLESIAKSPVFSHISSSIDGVTTIRSTRSEQILIKQFDGHQDVHTSAWYLTLLCSESFGMWLDLICVVFIICVIGGMVILDQLFGVHGSFAGLSISQSLKLTGMLQYCMSQITQVVNYLISVERVLEYTTLEREKPLETPKDEKPVEPWPSQGKIHFKHLHLTYVKNDPPVLNNLNLEIMPSEKIGIVGRTGAGKSSLIAALFRLAPIEGVIEIDGVNTQKLGLKDLRKKISIIPQEPMLFSATVRYNLDPFNEFEDEKLWNVLEEVELKDEVSSLDFMITEGGSNFSVGQRQLICLARAILRSNKILILDEATANVDPKTDELIQKTIRKKFKGCTVLTIAHRLNTIMDSDKVLVMNNGFKVEYDHPHILLQDKDGYFTKMVEETGPTMTKNLKTIARESYELNYHSS